MFGALFCLEAAIVNTVVDVIDDCINDNIYYVPSYRRTVVVERPIVVERPRPFSDYERRMDERRNKEDKVLLVKTMREMEELKAEMATETNANRQKWNQALLDAQQAIIDNIMAR